MNKATPNFVISWMIDGSNLKSFFFGFKIVFLPKMTHNPIKVEITCPMTVANAAPWTPHPKPITKIASRIILTIAPLPVINKAKKTFPETRVKSFNTNVNPWKTDPKTTMS